jgi:hypothetical protein
VSTGAGPSPPTRESWTGERRVTLDLDDCSRLDVLQSWRYVAEAGAHEVEGRVSAGGDGVHIRAWFDAEAVDCSRVERLRLGGGDHVRRVDMDRRHHIKPGQVLFTHKPGGSASPWRSTVERVLADLERRSTRLSTGWRSP